MGVPQIIQVINNLYLSIETTMVTTGDPPWPWLNNGPNGPQRNSSGGRSALRTRHPTTDGKIWRFLTNKMWELDISNNEYTVTQKKQGALTIQYVFQSFTRTGINLQLAGANLGT